MMSDHLDKVEQLPDSPSSAVDVVVGEVDALILAAPRSSRHASSNGIRGECVCAVLTNDPS